MKPELKVVSGGQTGVDRAVLDAAMELGIAVGGWCPSGREAEDGVIPARYPLQALKDGGYRERTFQNVIDSDATIIIFFGAPQGGTKQTLDDCREMKKECLMIDAEQLSTEEAFLEAMHFVEKRRPKVLNIAGPRASEHVQAYTYAKEFMKKLLEAS